MPPDEKDSKGPSFWSGLFTGAREAGLVAPQASADPPAAPAPVTATSRDDQQLASENAELRKQLARVQAERIQADAQSFIAQHAAQCYPAEAQALAALYIRAAETDATSPRTDGQLSCVALLEAATTARPAHQLSQDLIASHAPAAVLTNNANTEAAELDARAARVRERAAHRNSRRN